MDIVSGIVLGAVQGLTEFLPISSSGHLILARAFLGLGDAHGLAVDAVLQLATVLAVGLYFRRELWGLAVTASRLVLRRPVGATDRTLLLAIAVGTVPGVALGLLLEDLMETVFRSLTLVTVTLAAGALVMVAAEAWARQRPRQELTWKRGLAIGLFQSLALVPGMSRSGMTISGGLFSGLKRDEAARFSFLLAFPIIAGSGLKKLIDLSAEGAVGELGLGLAVGFATAFLVGLGAIHFLLLFLRRHGLTVFAAYRLLLAGLLIALTAASVVQM